MKGIGKFIMGGLILAIVAFFCWYFSDIIIYILIAVVISILGRPLMELLGYLRFKGIKPSEGLKAAITLIFIWTVFAMLFYSLIPLLVNEFSSLSKVDFTVVAVRLEAPLEYISSKLREFGMLDEGRDFKAYLAESIALEYIKSHAQELGIDEKIFGEKHFHIHVPSGAVPKDGPSAGVTMVTSLVSTITGKRVKKAVAMTGEITLKGKILPVGGIKEKILAAKRAGIKTVILCSANRKDIEEIHKTYIKGLKFIYADNISEVIDNALLHNRHK